MVRSKFQRRFRRASAALIISIVLILIGLSWILDRWTELTEFFIRVVRLRHAEVWLKRQSLWVGSIFLVPMVVGFVGFEIYKVHLVLNGRLLFVFVIGLVFKFVYLTIFHYMLHIYYERLIAIGWIAYCHGRYVEVRSWALATLKAQPFYRKAVAVKRRIQAWFRGRYTRFHVAKRWLRRT